MFIYTRKQIRYIRLTKCAWCACVCVWGGGVGQGQTKRQIVGSLDVSRSPNQTKKLRGNVLRFWPGASQVDPVATGLVFRSRFHFNTGGFGIYEGGGGGVCGGVELVHQHGAGRCQPSSAARPGSELPAPTRPNAGSGPVLRRPRVSAVTRARCCGAPVVPSQPR